LIGKEQPLGQVLPGFAAIELRADLLTHIGVPVAGVQKTTLHTFVGNGEEENEGLHSHIRWTKTPDFIHVYRGILPMNRVFFLTSVVCLLRSAQVKEPCKEVSKYKHFQRIVVFCSYSKSMVMQSKTRWESICSAL
jgi:hypothetical protein